VHCLVTVLVLSLSSPILFIPASTSYHSVTPSIDPSTLPLSIPRRSPQSLTTDGSNTITPAVIPTATLNIKRLPHSDIPPLNTSLLQRPSFLYPPSAFVSSLSTFVSFISGWGQVLRKTAHSPTFRPGKFETLRPVTNMRTKTTIRRQMRD